MLCAPYIDEQDLADCKMCSTGGLAVGQAELILMAASQKLYLETGQQFPGQCTDQVRPCNCSGCSGLPVPVRYSNGWRNVCGGCGGYCGASGAAILLPKRPVISVQSVIVDGVAEADWRLDSPGWLVRTDGSSWPTCQDITIGSDEVGAWEIIYTWGKMAPEMLIFATTVYASELVKACTGDTTCRIPAGAVTVQRQGVSYNFDIAPGKTGLYEVDQMIDALNKHGVKRKARIYSPSDTQWSRTVSGS